MKNKITIIAGHPDAAPERLSNAFVEAYRAAATKAGKEVRIIRLGAIAFDPILHSGFKQRQELEPDLVKAQEDIAWADHLVICYPTWWGGMPALLKGFIERVFLSGFAFKYRKDSPWWDKLLSGKSARIITTMDAPTFFYDFFLGAPGDKLIKNSILTFSGVNPVKFTRFGRARFATDAKRKEWLQKVEQLGATE